MKRLSIATLFILSSLTLFSQETKDVYIPITNDGIGYDKNGRDTIAIIDPMPEFKGGIKKLMKFLSKNLKYPETAQKANIEGKVLVSFIIARDGAIKDVKIIKRVYPDLDKEALRVIRKMPKWKPGEQHGKPVQVAYTLPINFEL